MRRAAAYWNIWLPSPPISRTITIASSAPDEVHGAGIPLVPEVSRVCVAEEAAVIIHRRELFHPQPLGAEPLQDRRRIVNAVRVEDDLGTPHREREVETTADRQHPGQLPDGLARPQRVDGVAIATQTDVLRDMQARDRGKLQVSKRECKEV